MGLGDKTFFFAQSITTGVALDYYVDIYDINGDGYVDIVPTSSQQALTYMHQTDPAYPSARKSVALINDGNGNFTPTTDVDMGELGPCIGLLWITEDVDFIPVELRL